MGKIVPVALATGSTPARYKQGGSAALVNCYIEEIGEEGKTPWAIYTSDGLQGFTTLPSANGGVRTPPLELDGVCYVVAGTRFYSITSTGIATLIASMNIDTAAPVYMERNRRSPADILIVCGGLAFYYRAGVLGQVTDPDLLGPLSMCFHDGYYVIGTTDNRFQSGALDDAANWDPLAYGRADANPDAVVRVATYQGDLVVFGEVSTQFERDAGTTPFPYIVIQSTNIGLLAANSVATVNQSLAFVAHDRTVRMFSGYDAQRISNHAVERDIGSLSDYSTITATSWVKNGHTFYCISCSAWTWIYDTLTQKWHQRKSYGLNSWNISVVGKFGGRILAGDRTQGILYEMSPDYTDDAGVPLISEVVLPAVNAFPYRLTINEIFFGVQAGVGTGQGIAQNIDPEMILSWSRDGGATYAVQRTLKLGQQGQNLTRVRTQRLGQFGEDGAVLRMSVSAKVARAIYQMSADVEQELA